MRNYTMPEWAEHYTRRAAGAQHDADAARQAYGRQHRATE